MFAALIRKSRQVMDDPVLRRWLIGRVLRKFPGEPAFTAHRPDYLQDLLPLATETANSAVEFSEIYGDAADTALDISLPDQDLTLRPGEEVDLFSRSYSDTETLLAVHRFAWLPLAGEAPNPQWVAAIWKAWTVQHGTSDDGWAWHPYTAAERAINILRFARSFGLPGPLDATVDCLARHAPAIAGRLEFFGNHHTSNHLANNGRGLFLIGLWLGLPAATDLGGRILIEEAARIFRPSGMLREGSSHYHLLLARNYDEVATEAEIHGRDEAAALRKVADKAKTAAAALILPGGLPLIGDISPDRPPQHLLEELTPLLPPPDEPFAEDGWLRHDHGSWSGIWHTAPQGWRQMPGHGHEDCGGFELHFGETPLFIDPGRGSYGVDGDAACSGGAHNTLLVNGENPYPPNRPYYDDHFRHLVCGGDPELGPTETGVRIAYNGFSRLANVGTATREWKFRDRSLNIQDHLEGRGKHAINRLLITPLAVTATGEGVVLQGSTGDFRIVAPEARVSLTPITRWTAYGRGEAATRIDFKISAPLPWRGEIMVEKT